MPPLAQKHALDGILEAIATNPYSPTGGGAVFR